MVKPTMSANVPVGYAMLVEAMREDAELRHNFFADLDLIFYAGASLPRDVWQGIEDLAMKELGRVPMLTSSWGMTETAPMALIHYEGGAESGMIGIPGPRLKPGCYLLTKIAMSFGFVGQSHGRLFRRTGKECRNL